jgi:hypothetical protein
MKPRLKKAKVKSKLETALCLCEHQKEAHVKGECVVCGCVEYIAQMKHTDENQLQQLLDWRQAENVKESQKVCPHFQFRLKSNCHLCFGEWFFWRTVRN